jgi:hypothetical protein
MTRFYERESVAITEEWNENMKTKITQPTYQSAPQKGLYGVDGLPLSPSPPSRLVLPFTIGVVIEIVTLIVVMVTCASNQFGVWNFALAVLGILLPLFLVTWGFWHITQDEVQSQRWMRDVVVSLQEAQPSLPLDQEPVTTITKKELVGVAR